MFWTILLVSAIAAIYWKFSRKNTYWKRKGVTQGNPTLFLGDNWGLFNHSETFAHFFQKLYNRFPDERYTGIYQFNRSVLMIRDPELLRQITVKDFDHFTDHVTFIPQDSEPLFMKNLFALKGDTWRHMRTTLSPAFTSSKMRAMFCMMSKCAENFTKHFLDQNSDLITFELKDSFTRYTNDIIATCAFGIECDSLKNRDNEFYVSGKKVTNFSGFWANMKFIVMNFFPKVAKHLGVRFFSKKFCDFFTEIISDTVNFREEKSVTRPDMIQLLMEARKGRLQYEEKQAEAKETGFATVEESGVGINTKIPKLDITIEDMAAQALIFFFAGFETTSIMMCFMGYELGVNTDIQEKLREEIDETYQNCNGELTYEALNKMKYMDMVITETLRKWPPVAFGDRICTKTYTIQPTRDSEVPVTLEKGDPISIPVYGIQHDPKYYEDPEKFDPERFSDENKGNLIPYTYLPFGVGPRNCIGSRFALLETKALFFHLLTKFEIVPVEKTEIPVNLDKSNFNFNAANGFWFGLKNRKV